MSEQTQIPIDDDEALNDPRIIEAVEGEDVVPEEDRTVPEVAGQMALPDVPTDPDHGAPSADEERTATE